jgi:hypothetical protein
MKWDSEVTRMRAVVLADSISAIDCDAVPLALVVLVVTARPHPLVAPQVEFECKLRQN